MTRLELDLGAIGRITIEHDDARELIKRATFWQSLPTDCPVCGAAVRIQHRRVKSTQQATYGQEFDFYRLTCDGTVNGKRHEATLGQHQDGRGLFYREDAEWAEAGQWREGNGDDHHEPAQAPRQPQQPAQRPAAPPARQHDQTAADAAKAPPPANGAQPQAGLQLRARLSIGYGITGKDHQLVAEHALRRPVTNADWQTLEPWEVDTIEQLADQIRAGVETLDGLRPA